jgi:hypothetical protein
MARLKISPRKLAQKTGVPEADTLIGDLIGEYSVEYIVPILQNSEEYKSLNGAEQAIFLKSVIDDYKADIMKLVKYRSQYEGRDKYGFDVMAKADFNKLNSTYQNKAFEEYDRKYGKPKDNENYDYRILTEMGRSWQKIFESRQ